MHKTSYRAMLNFYKKHVKKGAKVLDVGGVDINGSYREIFSHCVYETIDLEGGDYTVNGDTWEWPSEAKDFDVVISGQTFEHDQMFWLTLQSMKKCLVPNGMMCIIAPASGPLHRYPVDCYRFYRDSMPAFAKWLKIELIENYQIKVAPWYDIVGVFKNKEKIW